MEKNRRMKPPWDLLQKGDGVLRLTKQKEEGILRLTKQKEEGVLRLTKHKGEGDWLDKNKNLQSPDLQPSALTSQPLKLIPNGSVRKAELPEEISLYLNDKVRKENRESVGPPKVYADL